MPPGVRLYTGETFWIIRENSKILMERCQKMLNDFTWRRITKEQEGKFFPLRFPPLAISPPYPCDKRKLNFCEILKNPDKILKPFKKNETECG